MYRTIVYRTIVNRTIDTVRKTNHLYLERGKDMILAIGSRNDYLHIYNNVSELLADNAIGPGQGQFSGPIEFFDSDGHRLTGAHYQQGNLRSLNLTADPPDLSAVLQRLRTVFDHVRSFLDNNPEEAAKIEADVKVKSAFARLPHLSTSADLREFLVVFVSPPAGGEFSLEGEERHPGPNSIGHDLFHKFGG